MTNMAANPWAIPLSVVHRLIQDRQFDWPRRCPCGGELDQRTPGLYDCRGCGHLPFRKPPRRTSSDFGPQSTGGRGTQVGPVGGAKRGIPSSRDDNRGDQQP